MKYILAALAFLLPSATFAHTRWFAEDTLPLYLTSEPTELYISVWAGIIVVIILLGIALERTHWLDFDFLKPDKPHVFERAASTFTMVAGTFFIIAGTHEYLFSPNLNVEAGIPMWLIVLEILIGFAFLLGITSRICGILLGLMWFSLFYYAGPIAALEDIWVLSTAAFITLMGNEYFAMVSFSFLRNLVAPFKDFALPFLRVGTGLTLMILGLSEKIFAPEFGINFLEHHHWNFMRMFELNYSDYLFTISAGSVEFLFGLVFVLGLVTRVNALVVAVIFTIPLFILGPIELSGHLPHFAAVVLLLLFGGGNHLTLFPKRHSPIH